MNLKRTLFVFLTAGVLAAQAAAAWAALNKRDLETQAMERIVADDPRVGFREGEAALAEGAKSGDKAQQLKGMRLIGMALSSMEDATRLGVHAERGLVLARELKDAQAECEFLAGKATALGSDGRYLDALLVFDEAIAVAEKAGHKRCATAVMTSKGFNLGLLGRDSEALDVLFRAHQRF